VLLEGRLSVYEEAAIGPREALPVNPIIDDTFTANSAIFEVNRQSCSTFFSVRRFREFLLVSADSDYISENDSRKDSTRMLHQQKCIHCECSFVDVEDQFTL